MRIGIITTWSQPLIEPFLGGLESFTFHYIKYLADSGHQVIVCTHKDSDFGNHKNITSIPYERISQNVDAEVGDIKLNLNNQSEDYDMLVAVNHLDTHDCDIIHNHSMSAVPIKYQHVLHTPMITTFHENPVFINYLNGLLIDVASGNKKSSYVSISHYSKNCRQKYLPTISTIPNAINLNRRKYYDVPAEIPYYSNVGRISPKKGTLGAIQIAKKLGLCLKIAGKIYNQDYFDTIIKPELNDKIQYLGPLNQVGVNKLLGESQGFIFTPNHQEPFGLVMIEALASGTPVYAYQSGASSEIIVSEVGVTVQQGNQDELIRAISTLTFDRAKCRKHIEDNYSQEKMMENYIKLYKSSILLNP